MIIYFCDRELNILGQASTVLPAGNRISDDKTVEDVESGVNSFECTITWDAHTREELEDAIVSGNYILKQSDGAGYDSLFQILETESDTLSQEITLYAEDAGLDLINTLCPAVTLSNKTITEMMRYFLPADWTLEVWDAPTSAKNYAWDGESTCTERIRSVVGLWDCELYYSFRIDQLQVKEKIVNVVRKRGQQEAIPQLRLNYDIDRIVTKTSIANLVTALNVTGGTPEGADAPINLKNYDYSYTDTNGDIYTVDKSTGQMRNLTAMDKWSSAIDNDGLLVGSYSFDTVDKAVLAGQARAELQKRSKPEVNYEVDFARLPGDAQIGDRVNIIDDDGGLYLEARLLLIETCEADQTKKATIGEYLLKSSGISERVVDLAAQVKKQAESDQYFRDQLQVLTDTTQSMLNLEVESNIVAGRAFLRAHLFNGGKEVTTDYSEALYKWISRTENGETLLGRGYTLNLDLEEMGYAGTVLCRFIRPVLYDLTDHRLINITDENGKNIQVAYSGLYSQPVVRRTKALRALNKASAENETGYPNLSREVNLYEPEGLTKKLEPITQHFWTDINGAHITLQPKEEYEIDPTKAGGNLLAQSDGIYIKEGIDNLASFTGSGARVYTSRLQNVEMSNEGIAIRNIDNIEGYDFSWNTGVGAIYFPNIDRYFDGPAVSFGNFNNLPDGRLTATDIRAGGFASVGVRSVNNNGTFLEEIILKKDNAQIEMNYGGAIGFWSNEGALWFNTQGNFTGFTDYNGTSILMADTEDYQVKMEYITYSGSSALANVHVSEDGILSQGASSSRRIKTDIEDIGAALDPSKLYDARVVQFKYKEGVLNENDPRYGKDVSGFIAEELAEVYPVAVDYEEGQAKDWNYRYLLPPMLKLIQDQKKEIEELKERIEKLEVENANTRT